MEYDGEEDKLKTLALAHEWKAVWLSKMEN
jgi:hypothetical protein